MNKTCSSGQGLQQVGLHQEVAYLIRSRSGNNQVRKKFLKVYLEERLAEYLALGGLNELIQRVPLIEAGHKLPDPFFWDLRANLEHLRESYAEYCSQEHFNPEAFEEESVASFDTQT